VPRPEHLPEYSAPPVDEVVIGVEFVPLAGFSEVHLGLFWQAARDAFPIIERQPPIESVLEDLEGPPATTALQFQLAPMEHSRTWLKAESDDLLLQIQKDRFIHNWRRRDDAYPRFDTLLANFWRYFSRFRDAMAEQGLGGVDVRQLEVSYINWISDLTDLEFFQPAHTMSLDLKGLKLEPALTVGARYLALSDTGQPYGRLTAACTPALRTQPDGMPKPGTRFALAFKAPSQTSLPDSDITALTEKGRELIVEAFTLLTTSEAHERWGRTK
jgi:uncharacterized protein (TIGR04255 family)